MIEFFLIFPNSSTLKIIFNILNSNIYFFTNLIFLHFQNIHNGVIFIFDTIFLHFFYFNFVHNIVIPISNLLKKYIIQILLFLKLRSNYF